MHFLSSLLYLLNIMGSTTFVIVDETLGRNRILTFSTNKITFGRNPANTIDIPDCNISRSQCVIKLNHDDEWILQDTSSQKNTYFNGYRLQGSSKIKSGDRISFMHSAAAYSFYENCEDVPNKYRKRKRSDVETDDDVELVETTCLENELEKYKSLYKKASNNLNAKETKVGDLSKQLMIAKEELKVKDSLALKLKKENDEMLEKFQLEQLDREEALMNLMSTKEMLRDCEEDKARLIDEIQQHTQSADDGKPPPVIGDDLFSSDLKSIVDLVEVKWNEDKVQQLTNLLKEKEEKIFSLTYSMTKHRQDLIDAMDKELLCSICSDLLCNTVTLNCKHSFCKACLSEWKEKKKECPVCRTRIRSEVHPLVVDSFIDKFCEIVGGEVKARREEVKKERTKSATEEPGTSNWKGNRRNGSAGGPRRRRQNPVQGFLPFIQHSPAIFIELMEQPVQFVDLTGSPVTRARRNPRRGVNNNNM